MLLIEAHHFFLNLLPARVGCFKLLVLILQSTHLRLDFLHFQHRHLLLQPQRKEDNIQCDGQQDDRPSEIADVAVDPEETENQRPRNEFEPPVVDDVRQLGIRFTQPVPLFGSDVNTNRADLGHRRT